MGSTNRGEESLDIRRVLSQGRREDALYESFGNVVRVTLTDMLDFNKTQLYVWSENPRNALDFVGYWNFVLPGIIKTPAFVNRESEVRGIMSNEPIIRDGIGNNPRGYGLNLDGFSSSSEGLVKNLSPLSLEYRATLPPSH